MSRKFALIIGNSQFDDSTLAQLNMPEKDVEALAGVLRDPEVGGFDDVKVLTNEAVTPVRREIARFFTDRKRQDLLLLYFSGHGVRDLKGRLYLAVRNSESPLWNATAVAAELITDAMDSCRSRRQVLILDCCHSGAYAQGMKGVVGESVGTRVAFQGNGFGRVVLTASDATEYAFEGDQIAGQAVNSVFTHHLIQGLRTGAADVDQDGWVSLDELYDYVYERVIEERPEQTPGKWSYKQQGALIVARNPRVRVPAGDLPVDLQQATESRFVRVREGAVAELEALLQGSDKPLVTAARAALLRLAKDDSRRVSAAAARALGHSAAPPSTPPSPPMEPAPRLQPRAQSEAGFPVPEMMPIPGGPFTMGTSHEDIPSLVELYGGEAEYYRDEVPQHTVDVTPFEIGKYPVTNREYQAFVRQTGRKPPRGWQGDAFPPGKGNHPVVNVSWYDAVAYCRWLSEQTSSIYRLPTEAEWEKAARGTDGRQYPWGDTFDAARCNVKESEFERTTPVNQYRRNVSPYGVMDMAGNVWEWCSSLYAFYPFDVQDGREDPGGKGQRSQRGGSWYNERSHARCAYRIRNFPDYAVDGGGFRCARDVD